MSNKTQKIQKAQKRVFTKILLFSFYFLMICYCQCSYAVIEEYLIPGADDFYKLGTIGSRTIIDSMELATEVATYLKSGRLREVYIQLPEPEEQDNIRQLILKALAEALRDNTTLTTLDIKYNRIGDEGAIALAEVLKNNTTLTTLYLGSNQIGAEGVRALAEALRDNTALTMLELGENQVGAEGARALAEALRDNTALTTLDLWRSQIDDEGVRVLAEVLRSNMALTTLNLWGNRIGTEGARALAEALRNNTSLTTLSLGYNQIGAEGARALAEALRNNTVLMALDLYHNQIGVEGDRELAAVLTENYTLLEFINDNWDENVKSVLRNNLLIRLLRKIKCASSFTFAIGFHHTPLRYLSQTILAGAGLNVRNRTAFENIQNYNTEGIRVTIFKGSLEEIIRLFYYGNDAEYGEILREVNEIRRLQREILQENQRAIPQGLVELPKYLPGGGFWTWVQGKREEQQRDFVTTTFWTS